MEHRLDLTGTRSILSNLEEYRAAVAEIATRANRTLSIYTTDLEPLIYDHDLFLEPVKRLVLARSHARLRVLISNPGRVSREGNRFMMMARRLTSYIDLRNVAPEYRSNPCSFIVADDKAIAYRQQASTLGRHRRVQRRLGRQALSRLLRRSLGWQPGPARNARHGRRLLTACRRSGTLSA